MNARALAFVLLAACASNDAAVEPVWGKEPCAHCAMVLSDRRFGAQLVTRAGDRKFFDDVGCMIQFASDRGEGDARAWVRDGESGKWLDARSAQYVAASSPMDFGFEARAQGGVAWDAMRAQVLAKKRGSP
jgi:copper chaperone NosL